MYYLKREPLPVFSLCAMKVFEPAERHIQRVFDKSVLILMLDGILRFEEDGVPVELQGGEYYIQRAGLLQTGERPSESARYLFLHFSGSFSENPKDGIPVRGTCAPGAVQSAAREFERLYRIHDGSFFARNALMFQVFADLEHNASVDSGRAHIARDIRRFIAAEFSTPLSLSKIAARYGYSEDYTIRLFKKEFGITPYRYLVEMRLSQAERLLRSTERSVEAISREVGYNDFSTFYRDFRKRYGCSPSELRTASGAPSDPPSSV